MNTCENCRFVHEEGINKETMRKVLTCRRYPPTVQIIPTPQGPMTASGVPQVQKEYYCGEWAPGEAQLN